MRKNNWTATTFRFLLLVCISIFMALTYWSSLITEEKLEKQQKQIEEIWDELKREKRSSERRVFEQVAPERDSLTKSNILESSYPNLLSMDPYYEKIVPKLVGKDFVPHGTLRMATYGKMDNLHPFSQFAQVSEWLGYAQGKSINLRFGFYQILAEDFAIKLEERPTEREDLAAFWVYLRDDIYWEPLEESHFPKEITLDRHFLKKHPVTAYDFQLFFQAFSNPYVDVAGAVTMRQALKYIEDVEVINDKTYVVYYKKTAFKNSEGAVEYMLPYRASIEVSAIRPLPCFVYTYQQDGTKIIDDSKDPKIYKKSSVWAQHFVKHFTLQIIPSCGPWLFDGKTDSLIRFRRNGEYFDPYVVLYDAMEISMLESPEAIWRDFIGTKIDLCILPSNMHQELERFLDSDFYKKLKTNGHEVKKLEYLMRMFTYVAFNQKNELFSSKKVRQALSVAIDTNRLIHQHLNDQAVEISGPFFIESTANDPTIKPWSYDPEKAKRLLAEEGWFDSDGDGVVDKEINGVRVPFRFSLTFYVKNPVTKGFCQSISSYLKKIGIDCILRGVDVADLSAEFDDKSFDALYMAWALGTPPEDPEQIWHSSGVNEKGSANAIAFSNKEVDEMIDKLKFEKDIAKRTQYYHRIHEILHDECPYLFLYTPKTTLVYWNWIQNLFIPKNRQDLIPGADVVEPSVVNTWKK